MSESTSTSYTPAVPPGTPTPGEDERREAFQAAHPEVGFAFRPGREPPWVGYWLAAGDERRHVAGTTLGEVLDSLAEVFG